MRRLWLLALAALLITGCGDTAEKAKKPDADPADATSSEPADSTPSESAATEPTPAEAFAQLNDEFDQAQQEFIEKLRGVSRAEQIALRQKDPRPAFVSKFIEFAEAHADAAVAMDAWRKVVEIAPGDQAEKGIDKLIEHDPNDEQLLAAITRRSRSPNPKVEEWLNKLVDNATDDKVRGTAMLSLANYIGTLADFKSYADNPQFVAQMPEIAEYLKKDRPSDEGERVTALLNEVAEKYGDVPFGRGSNLAEEAEGALFVINYLSIGKEAPDIEGTDLDGEEFKLSDYRGKVVMLDFWGDW